MRTGRVVYIGFAGGRSLFGLRSELERALQERPAGAARFRTEVNQQYTSRYQELLMLHVADHGCAAGGEPGRSAGAARAAQSVVKCVSRRVVSGQW